tara:strand:- start:111 stop:449 length:339 start_codon:yes stop_codon:yes gene_type:complete
MMSMYLLNISVDTEDPSSDYFSEDLSFNDQESIVEILIEQVLGFENAFQEYDDQDSNTPQNKRNVITDWIVAANDTLVKTNYHFSETKISHVDYAAPLRNACQEVDSPPPKM